MRKEYVSPKVRTDMIPNEAVPLAFFSAATAAAAVVGAAVGAVATAKALGDISNLRRSIASQEITGLCA
ncbi:MAG: hypothetical protein NTW85_10440 [Methylococcales bacterium]|nr:hypothetical protein [Methylococcales bacterium]